jgi:hypothetical protein
MEGHEMTEKDLLAQSIKEMLSEELDDESNESQIKSVNGYVDDIIAITRMSIDTMCDVFKEKVKMKKNLDEEDIGLLVKKINKLWDHKLSPLYRKVCAGILNNEYIPDKRRSDFLIRLLFSKVVLYYKSRPHLTNKPHLSAFKDEDAIKIAANGFRVAIQSMYSEREYNTLNKHAQMVYNLVKIDDDEKFWEACEKNELATFVSDKLFVMTLLKFESFLSARTSFMSIMSSYMKLASAGEISGRDFCEIFDSLFMKYFMLGKDHKNVTDLNLLAGPGAWDSIARISSAYEHYRKSYIKDQFHYSHAYVRPHKKKGEVGA